MTQAFRLTPDQQDRLQRAIRAALGVPFIAGVEGYVWEAIFHYVKGLDLPNPHSEKRKKLLFDAVDRKSKTGWSLKAVQKSPNALTFELVIQRADVIKKKMTLGFPELTLKSSPQHIGNAVLRHWNSKILSDMHTQGVVDGRVGLLLKSKNHRQYTFIEQKLRAFAEEELSWSWTDKTETGLQAKNNNDGRISLRWYPNQKQLFETFEVGEGAYSFGVDPDPLDPDDFIKIMFSSLQDPALDKLDRPNSD
jgi:hypothetical protein